MTTWIAFSSWGGTAVTDCFADAGAAEARGGPQQLPRVKRGSRQEIACMLKGETDDGDSQGRALKDAG